jgi:DNA-binding MarR family transcriptional regulator
LDQPVKHRVGSKQARIIEMLMRAEGATIDDIIKATNWQQHSVRGFFAGIIRKKLKLTLISQATESGRIYKITGNAASAASAGSKPGKFCGLMPWREIQDHESLSVEG